MEFIFTRDPMGFYVFFLLDVMEFYGIIMGLTMNLNGILPAKMSVLWVLHQPELDKYIVISYT